MATDMGMGRAPRHRSGAIADTGPSIGPERAGRRASSTPGRGAFRLRHRVALSRVSARVPDRGAGPDHVIDDPMELGLRVLGIGVSKAVSPCPRDGSDHLPRAAATRDHDLTWQSWPSGFGNDPLELLSARAVRLEPGLVADLHVTPCELRCVDFLENRHSPPIDRRELEFVGRDGDHGRHTQGVVHGSPGRGNPRASEASTSRAADGNERRGTRAGSRPDQVCWTRP